MPLVAQWSGLEHGSDLHYSINLGHTVAVTGLFRFCANIQSHKALY